MKDEIYAIALKSIKGLGEVTFKNLLARYENLQAVLAAPYTDLIQTQGLSQEIARLISGFDYWQWAEEELARAQASKADVICLSDADYPANISNIYNPPAYLFAKGSIIEQDSKAIGIVGSRLSDSYGKRMTEQLAGELAANGITVASGGARGIDTISHRACLKAGG